MEHTSHISSIQERGTSFLQDLLVAPRYRIWRHIILFTLLSFISFNQVLVYFAQVAGQLGSTLYLIASFYLLTYLVMGYFNLYYLLPRFLLTRQYGKYFFWFLLLIAVMLTLQLVVEGRAKNGLEGVPPFALNATAVTGFLSAYLVDIICFTGASMTVLMRYWMIGNKEISEMEQHQLRSEVEQLKEQISPSLLFNVLNRTALKAQEDPALASDMLVKLSQLLRYQLYDCGRERVLLQSEITFLRNYLLLEQRCSGRFSFEIRTSGEINRWMVSPLLFVPFIQTALRHLYGESIRQEEPSPEGEMAQLRVRFLAEGADLLFTCEIPVKVEMEGEELTRVCQRLEFLYPERYKLTQSCGKISLKLTQAIERSKNG